MKDDERLIVVVGDGSIIKALATLVRTAVGPHEDDPLTEAECEEMRMAAMEGKRDYDSICNEVRSLRAALGEALDLLDRFGGRRYRPYEALEEANAKVRLRALLSTSKSEESS